MRRRYSHSLSNKQYWAIMAIFLALFITISLVVTHSCNNSIDKKIESIGGQVMEVKLKGIFESNPWHWYNYNKSDLIYKVKYKIDGKEKIAWVKFSIFGTKWRLDYPGN